MRLYLAPMAEISTAAFREICYRNGADVCYSEMISAKAVMFNNKKTIKMAMIRPEEPRTFVQIFGSDPDDIAGAIRRIEELCPPYGFDINMGCPMKKVIKGRNGAFLMTDPDKVRRVVRAARAATKKPLSVKIRKGYIHENGSEVAAIIEEEGADLLVIHPRLKTQMFLPGTCDPDFSIRIAVERKIPVIHSGDITGPKDIERFADSRVAGVMIGRGTFGRPWIFDEIRHGVAKDAEERKAIMKLHFNAIRIYSRQLSEKAMMSEIKKNAVWYSRGYEGAAEFRNRVYQTAWAESDLMRFVGDFFGMGLV
ncbi:MAG TPA: tRNA-dihydrouridine synthase family protein [bacterium]|nr:tRNA-dihydrouridine synthase family protein [bacterium]